MHKQRRILQIAVTSMIVLVQLFFPAVTMAETATDPPVAAPTDSSTTTSSTKPAESTTDPGTTPSSTDTAPTTSSTTTGPTDPTGPTTPTGAQSPTGPTTPTGADGSTYHLNEATGMWENDYYIWDPVTHQTKPKTPQTYSYNPQTKMWDTTEWYFSPESGTYKPNVKSVTTPPKGAVLKNASISNTGANSNNQIGGSGSNNGTFDLFFNAQVSNKIGQMSQSGNALVQGNLSAGDATSGDAQSIANILSMLQSSWGLNSQDIATFIASIDGNVVGDLTIDPSGLAPNSGNSNIDVNVSNNAAINNDIDVSAKSGNATINSNTTGGSATTGNASALVNLINLINSAINARQSFVGILNINGSLDGDILLPPGLLQAIIAATGPNSNNTINSNGNSTTNVDINTNRSITNQVTSDATSGDATVRDNTSAGSATTGNTENNLVLLNLTGKQVVAKDALVVFVNVFGSWVGLIMNAPAGTNAAAITNTGASSNNTIDANGNTTTNVNVDENSQINNNIKVSAQSGNAEVSQNTNGGNAKSGNANTGVNVLNMIDSSFNVSDWFGVLFINVFGTWNGSFGVNTAAGNHPVAGGMGGGSTSSTQTANKPVTNPGTFGFIPKTQSQSNFVGTSSTNNNNGSSGSVQGATKETTPTTVITPHANQTVSNNSSHRNWIIMSAGLGSGLLLLGADWYIGLKRRWRNA